MIDNVLFFLHATFLIMYVFPLFFLGVKKINKKIGGYEIMIKSLIDVLLS